jgi:hypothetical protein
VIEWQPIETAPDCERVWVAGWYPPDGDVDGYWWWEEDYCIGGEPVENSDATHWCKIKMPEFPEPPK